MSNSQDPYQPGPTGSLPQQLPPPPEQPAPFGPAGGTGVEWAGPSKLPGELRGERPRPRSRRRLWIILGSIGAVLLLVVLGVVILVNVVGGAASQAKGLADDFTKKVIAGDTSAAYDDYLDPALQEQLSKEAFMSGVRSLGMDGSCRPAYNDVKVATDNGMKSAEVAGQIACTGKNVDLAYRFEGKDRLLMTSIKLRPAS